MSRSEASPARSRPRWRRLLKRLLLTLLLLSVLLLALVLVFRSHTLRVAEQRLQEAIARADQLDPGWTFEEIQAGREQIADEQNSAVQILAVAKHLPRDWPWRLQAIEHLDNWPDRYATLLDNLEQTSPEQRLTTEQRTELTRELEPLERARIEARGLGAFQKGRYVVTYAKDYMSTRFPDLDKLRQVGHLLAFDAALLAEDGNIEQAFRSIESAVTVGRSVGDEPNFICQLARMGCRNQALASLERALGQGRASIASLTHLQDDLQRESAEPLLLIALRGERCGLPGMMEALRTGNYQDELGKLGRVERWIFSGILLYNQAKLLEYMTDAVEIAKLPFDEQRDRYVELWETRKEPDDSWFVYRNMVPAISKVADAFDKSRAKLHCAVVALALERFHLAHGDWPGDLEKLVPTYLKKVPADPFTNGPMRYRRLEDGVVIYSIGFDGEDDGGEFDRKFPGQKDADIGFRLWNPEHRAQPAKVLDRANQTPLP